jgi:hypothetical protein
MTFSGMDGPSNSRHTAMALECWVGYRQQTQSARNITFVRPRPRLNHIRSRAWPAPPSQPIDSLPPGKQKAMRNGMWRPNRHQISPKAVHRLLQSVSD